MISILPGPRSTAVNAATWAVCTLTTLCGPLRPAAAVAVWPPQQPPAAATETPPTVEELQRLLGQAEGLRAEGKYVHAIEATRIAQEALRRAGHSKEAVTMYAWLAACHRGLEQYDQELASLEAGRREFELLLGEAAATDVTLPLLLIDTSICLGKLGRNSQAVDIAREADQVVRAAGMPLAVRADTLNIVGRAELAAGRPAEALLTFEHSLSLLPADHPERSSLRFNIANSLLALGNAEAALSHLEALAQSGTDGTQPPFADRLLRSKAAAFFYLGRFDDAATALGQALALREQSGLRDSLETARLCGDLATCLRVRKRPQESLELLQTTLASVRKRFDGDRPEVAFLLRGLAASQRDLGHATGDRELFDRATTTYQESAAMGRRLGAPDTLFTLTALANHLLDRPDDVGAAGAERAAGIYREAITEAEVLRSHAMGVDEVQRAMYFSQLRAGRDPFEGLARALLRVGRVAEAVRYLEFGRARSSLDLLEHSRFDRVEESRRRAGRAGDHATLARIDGTARAIEATDAEIARCRQGLSLPGGAASEARANIQSAQARLRDLLRERDALTKGVVAAAEPEELATIRPLLGDGERILFYLLGEDSHLFVVPPPGREILHAPLRRQDGTPVSEAAIRAAVTAYRMKLQSPGQGLLADRGAGRTARTASTNELPEQLFGMLVPSPVWDDVRTASLVYVVPHGALHLLPFEALIVEPAASDGGKGEQSGQPTYWLDVGPSVAYTPSASLLAWSLRRRAGQTLGRRASDVVVIADPSFAQPHLLEVSADAPAGATVVRVRRDGAGAGAGLLAGDVVIRYDGASVEDAATLGDAWHRAGVTRRDTLPLEIWRCGEPLALEIAAGDPCIEVGSGPPARVLRDLLRNGPKETVAPTPETPAAHSAESVHRLPALPGARREAADIRTALERGSGSSASPTQVVIRLGAAATETALFDLAPHARVLHIATHLLPDAHGRWAAGRIVLGQVPVATAEDDGLLDLDDLLLHWRGRLDGCELVVISSCRSRLGTLHADEGIFGFPLGFHYAGCPTVIASLWSVSDAATAELMPAFYADIAGGGDGSRLGAFRAARRALRKQHPDPFYWAPFVWIGAPR